MDLIPDFKLDNIDNIEFRISEKELELIDNFISSQNYQLVEFINKSEKLDDNKIKLKFKKKISRK